ncbi:hypothetical protein WG947_04590 [Pontibacter sp. H259]|uniref:hypothetical protein n=1 Tax=Pontibacter sp. H259 TaxID=3133421 RepID=UPI0030C23C30
MKQLKRNLLITGLFLAAGGTFAVIRELQSIAYAPGAVIAAVIVLVTGLVCVAVSRDVLPLKDAYFLMNPSRVSFRMTLVGREQVLQWSDIAAVTASENRVVFTLCNNRQVTMRLTTIPDEHTARHIRASIQLAALEQNVVVNGVAAHAKLQLVS